MIKDLYRGPFFVEDEQPVRQILFASRVPLDGGIQRICARFLRGIRLVPLNLLGDRACMEKVEAWRGCNFDDGPFVGVRNLVGTFGARCGALFSRGGGLGVTSQGGSKPLHPGWSSGG